MIWRVLDFLFATALLVGLVLDVRAQRRRWSPDISAGFKMTAPPGWTIRSVELRRADGVDVVAVYLQRLVPSGKVTTLGDAA